MEPPIIPLNQTSYTAIFVDMISGIENLSFNIDSQTSLSHVIDIINTRIPEIVSKRTYLSFKGGSKIQKHDLSKNLYQISPEGILNIRMNACLCGGKGGFGSMLRSQGSRMSRKKKKTDQNMDSWKTLDGHKMREVRKAKEMAQLMERDGREKREAIEKKKKKLEAILSRAGKKNSNGPNDINTSEFLEESETLVNEVHESMKKALMKEGKEELKSDKREVLKDISIGSSEKSIKSKSRKISNYFDEEDEEE